jgi:hypothetical protein
MDTMDLGNNDSGMVPLNPPEKNMPPQQINMDAATPLDEIMSQPEVMAPQDPRTAHAFHNIQQSVPQIHQVPSVPQMSQGSKNPMNLTDEQMEALFAGAVAMVAFSKPVQEKLIQSIPQFLDENGSRSMIGLLITGIVAALVFYFSKRFVMKN